MEKKDIKFNELTFEIYCENCNNPNQVEGWEVVSGNVTYKYVCKKCKEEILKK